jgi:HSP20 family protein
MRVTRRAPRLAFTPFPAVPAFEDVENRLQKLLEGTLPAPFDGNYAAEAIGWLPATEIAETEDELTLTAELPGLEKKDVDISVDEGVLTIRGEKVAERTEGEAEKKFHMWERSYGSFQRSFTLPRTVDAAKITADFDKGVLKVKLPKSAEAKVKGRKIEINAK